MKNSIITKEELSKLEFINETNFFRSRFLFTRDHCGLRKGQYHLLIGPSGCGKSSLVRSMAIDCAHNETETVLIHLSEETEDDWKYKFYKQQASEDALSRIFMLSESTNESMTKSMDKFFKILENKITESGCTALILDNISTSCLYTHFGLKGQEEAIKRLKWLANKYFIAVLVVIHTRKEIDDNYRGIIKGEDVRGTAVSHLYAPYEYVFQNFRNEMGYNPTICITKSRFHDCTNQWYALQYHKETSNYLKDKRIDFKVLKQLFEDRYNLTGK